MLVGTRISLLEKVKYDKQVVVMFQDNAWCDERVMEVWIRQQWKPVCDGEMLLVADVHKAQKTEAIQTLLKRDCGTDIVFVPPGTTSLVHAPFKAAIDKLATEHLHHNVNVYLQGQINASQRRILLATWIGQAWEEVASRKDMIRHSFKKCGISVAIDGSEDNDINIEGLENYSVNDEELDDSDGGIPFLV